MEVDVVEGRDAVVVAGRLAEQLQRPVGQHLVDVHVGARAGAALQAVDDDLGRELAVGQLAAGALDGVGLGRVVGPGAERPVGEGAGELDRAVGGDSSPCTGRPPAGSSLDRLAALRLDHRARHGVETAALEITEHVDRELFAAARGLNHRIVVGVLEEELELARVRAAVDAARAEAVARLHEHRKLEVVRQRVRQPRQRGADAALLEQLVREPLVRERVDDLRRRQQNERAELVARASKDAVVEVGERGTTSEMSCASISPQRGHVAGVAHARDEACLVRVVERGRERVHVGRERPRAGALESRNDVDPLASAGEGRRSRAESVPWSR